MCWDECYDEWYKRSCRLLNDLGYYDNDVLIWIVDAADRCTFDGGQHSSKNELHRLLQMIGFNDSVVLILANKMDLPNKMGIDEIGQRLEMIQDSILSIDQLVDIKNHCLLHLIPDGIIKVICQYTPQKVIGPCFNGVNGTQKICNIMYTSMLLDQGEEEFQQVFQWLDDNVPQTKKAKKDCILM